MEEYQIFNKEILKLPRYIKQKGKKKGFKSLIKKSDIERIKNNVTNLNLETFLEKELKVYNKKYEYIKAPKSKLERLKINKLKKEIDRLKNIYNDNNQDKEFGKDLKNKAIDHKHENTEEVKVMNSMIKYAECVTIRDRQLIEKRILLTKNNKEQKKLDDMMEKNRQERVKEENQKDNWRINEELKGRKIIINQIEKNKKRRDKIRKDKIQESKKLLQKINDLNEKDRINLIKKVKNQKEIKLEINKFNKQAIKLKKLKIVKEKVEEEKIATYLKEKAIKEEEYFKKQLLIKEEKERKVALLREKQEKAMDLKLELDKLRAKRAMQKEERNQRQKDLLEKKQKEKMNDELKKARLDQIKRKREKLIEQANREKVDFNIILNTQKQAIKTMKENNNKKERIKNEFVKELDKKVKENLNRNTQLKKEKDLEGKKMREKFVEMENVFLNKKKEKVKYLDEKGILDKYKTDLKIMKFFRL